MKHFGRTVLKLWTWEAEGCMSTFILDIIKKGKVPPITGHEGPEGEQRYSPTLLWPRHLDGGGWSAPRPSSFTPRKDPVPIVYEAGCAPGPVCTGAENLAPTGIRSPDRPARSESLYRLSYSGPYLIFYIIFITKVRDLLLCNSWSRHTGILFGLTTISVWKNLQFWEKWCVTTNIIELNLVASPSQAHKC